MLLLNENLAKYTTLKVGGPGDVVCIPESRGELLDTLQLFKHKGYPITVIGNGSNVLIKDGGIRGITFILTHTLKEIDIKGNTVYAGAGVFLNDLIRLTIVHKLKGLECLWGIPGTVGGALYMNAGFTAPIGPIVDTIESVTFEGIHRTHTKDELHWAHRTSIFKEKPCLILGCTLNLSAGDCAETVKRYTALRLKKQPINVNSCGSVFKNVDMRPFKGLCVGDAEVSPKCPKFIINKGNAKAKDILALIDTVKHKVVNAQLEVCILGEDDV
jgi:UDP-N-acetylmuramate dehydrogenase